MARHMNVTIRRSAWSVLFLPNLALLSACGESATDLWTAPAPLPGSPLGSPASAWGQVDDSPLPCDEYPALAGPGRVFGFYELIPAGVLHYDDRDGSLLDGTRRTRYALYDDGTFALHSCGPESWVADGTYTGTDTLTLRWYANSTIPPDYPYPPSEWPGPWEATAELRGDTLRVMYNARMGLEGFLSAAYVQAAPP